MEEIAQTLQGTLSAEPNTRIAAELRLNKLLAHAETGLALATLTVSNQLDVPIRQAAGVLTRKYVAEYWSPYFSTYKGPSPSPELKHQIRQTIFQGLSDPNRKIRTASAYIVSTIAQSDWPDEYPDLLTSLTSNLTVAPDAVHGSLQVFTEFMKHEVTEVQLMPVLRELLPALLQILGQPQVHSPITRARTVFVFRQCVLSLAMLKEQYPDATKEASTTVLPQWLDAFNVLLQSDPRNDVVNESNWDGLAVKVHIFKSLITVLSSFPRALIGNLDGFVNAATAHFVALAPTYTWYYVAVDGPSPPTCEEDPEGVTIPAVVTPAMDFLSALISRGRLTEWLGAPEHVQALVSSIVIWSQITQDEEGKWADDPNSFVFEDDDEAQADNLRAAAFTFLGELIEKAPTATIAALNGIITTTVAESNTLRQAGNPSWWKSLESLLAALASSAGDLLEHKELVNFDLLFAEVIPSLLTIHDTPFLTGRAFVFASRFAHALPLQLAQRYLVTAAEALEGNAGTVVKISAVKAVRNFCQQVKDPSITELAPRLLKIVAGPLLGASEDTLSLVTETLVAIVSLDDGRWLTPEFAAPLAISLLDVWQKNVKDHLLFSVLTDAFVALAKAQYHATVSAALPRLSSTLASLGPNESWIAVSAIEIISSIIRGAPTEAEGLGQGVFAQLAPHLFSALDTSEDRDLLQSSIVCLTLFVRKDCQQILAYPEGLNLLLRLISRTLLPADGNESGGLVVGDLMLHLLRKAGTALLPSLQDMLQALLNRMTTAKTGTFIQSLVTPFTYLLYTQRDDMLNMLESTQLQNGSNALQVLLTVWCENAETFMGFWAQRLSNLALSSLFASERPSLQSITVRGDLIIKPETSNRIMTRSRTKQVPHEYAMIPFPVKALKLLVLDLQSGGDAAAISAASGAVGLVDSDSDGSEWADEGKIGDEAWLSDLLGPGAKGFEDDDVVDDHEDDDFADDPISRIDMKSHLISFLKECAARNTSNFNATFDQLKVEEQIVIRTALQSP